MMPSVISHAVVAVAAGVTFVPREGPNHFRSVVLICSIIPDVDSIAFSIGIPYVHLFGHRGFFHSPFFGLLWSLFFVSILFRGVKPLSRGWFFYLLFLFLLAASHGLLDALTNGGLGVALLSPFDQTRYFLPWRPIVVSPMGVAPFFSRWGLAVIKSELLWVWLPCFIMVIASAVIRLFPSRQ
jgi:inner membrane protein